LLNLFLSMLAAIQSAVLLVAAKSSDQVPSMLAGTPPLGKKRPDDQQPSAPADERDGIDGDV